MTLREFDRLPEVERDYWLADWQAKRLECPDCGCPADECSDPARAHYPYRRVCYPTMERVAADARYADLHEDAPYHDGSFGSWSDKRSRSHPYHFNEGVTVGVAERDLTPWDKFTTDVHASPVPPSPGDAIALPALDERGADEGHPAEDQ